MKLIPEVGDFVTVTEWTSHKDNSYKGDVIEVMVVDYPLFRGKNHTYCYGDGNVTLDLSRLNIRELSAEFVADVLAK